jgi:tetratricopeptide (TPR) repeat protein
MRRWLAVLAGLLLVLLAWQQTGRLLENACRRRPKLPVGTLPAPAIGDADPSALLPRILRDGNVDDNALADIEKQGNPAVSAVAYFAGARYEYERQRRESAIRYLQRSLEFAPNQAGLHQWHAALLLESGQYAEAVAQGERAVQLEPGSAEAQRILGLAYYDAGRSQDALEAWDRSLQLAPNEQVRQYADKARREARVEENFTQTARGHFVLRFEGGQPGQALSDELLALLELQFDDLARDLGSSPSAPIVVTLYNGRQFSDVTQAPSWAGAVNDGKLRIPLGDVTTITPQLEAVLRHELTHSFIHAAVPHCPAWLNEGLAQFEEPKDSAAVAARLLPQLRSGQAAPLRELEAPFAGLSREQAETAYAESLAAVEYLRRAYGMYGLQRLLSQLADGEDPETALRDLTLGGYADLQRDLAMYLAGRS